MRPMSWSRVLASLLLAHALGSTAAGGGSHPSLNSLVAWHRRSVALPAEEGQGVTMTRPLPARRQTMATGGVVAHPIRIHVEYQGNNQTQAQPGLLQLLVSTASAILGSHLSVRTPAGGQLLVPPVCSSQSGPTCTSWYPDFGPTSNPAMRTCGLATINPAHILNRTQPACAAAAAAEGGSLQANNTGCTSVAGGPGFQTDLYIYVTAFDDVGCSTGAASSALPCLFGQSNSRPLMGAINVCPNFLASDAAENLLGVVLHEMIHILGFIDSLYGLYVDASGNRLSGVLQSSIVNNAIVQFITTPRVVQEVRSHFGCPTLQGAQLEALGGAGSSGSHWEYMQYQGEVMVASTTFSAQGESPRLTALTLALLQDTGWYVLNSSTPVASLTWGRNAGCDFVNLGCRQYMERYPSNPFFCRLDNSGGNGSSSNGSSTSGTSGGSDGYTCSPSLKSQATCMNVTFADPGCGMLVSRSGGQSCLDPAMQYDDPQAFGWWNGPSSRCIAATYKLVASSGGMTYTFPGTPSGGGGTSVVSHDAVCFPMYCSVAGELFLDISGHDVRCSSGSTLDLAQLLPDLYSGGSLGPCPENAAACATLACANCTAGGDCINGTCVCKLAYSGPYCEHDLLTGETEDSWVTEVPPPVPAPKSSISLQDLLVLILVCTATLVVVVAAVFAILRRWGRGRKPPSASRLPLPATGNGSSSRGVATVAVTTDSMDPPLPSLRAAVADDAVVVMVSLGARDDSARCENSGVACGKSDGSEPTPQPKQGPGDEA